MNAQLLTLNNLYLMMRCIKKIARAYLGSLDVISLSPLNSLSFLLKKIKIANFYGT